MWKNGISQHLKSLIHDNVVNVISDIYKINKSGNVVNLARIDKKRTTTDNELTLWVAAEGAAGCFDSWACSFIRKICSSSHVTSVSRCCTACTHKQRQRRVTHDDQRPRRVTHDDHNSLHTQLGLLIDIRKSAYRILAPISGYGNTRTIIENGVQTVRVCAGCLDTVERDVSWYSETWYAASLPARDRCSSRHLSHLSAVQSPQCTSLCSCSEDPRPAPDTHGPAAGRWLPRLSRPQSCCCAAASICCSHCIK